jgi:hypothetical protein
MEKVFIQILQNLRKILSPSLYVVVVVLMLDSPGYRSKPGRGFEAAVQENKKYGS